MTATITRPKRWAWGECPQCHAAPNQFHIEACSCDQLGHEWQRAIWDDDGLAQECAWCGKITGGPRLT